VDIVVVGVLHRRHQMAEKEDVVEVEETMAAAVVVQSVVMEEKIVRV
jgi:hypothetical protein